MKKKILHEVSSSALHIVEMSSSAVNGRRRAKLVLHEIYPDDTRWQENGLSWLREYTEQNMHTVEGMSVTVEFADGKKREPFGHGYSGVNPDNGMPEFNDAVMVGFTHSPKIEEVSINGRIITALTAEASLDQHRYPLFVDWLFCEVNSGNTISGSIEIVGADEGSQIQYEAGEWTPTGRVPIKFAYSGYAILGIRAADPSAVILELSSMNREDRHGHEAAFCVTKSSDANNQEKSDLNFVKEKISEMESNCTSMNREDRRGREAKSSDAKQNIGVKKNKKEVGLMNEKAILAELSELKKLIAELNSSESDDKKMADICAENELLKRQIAELEEKLEKATSENNEMSEKNTALEAATRELEKKQLIAELNSALAKFTDEQKKVAQKEIDAFVANPMKSEINSVVAAIKIAIADKVMESAKIMAEQNSMNDDRYTLNSVFGSMDEAESTGVTASIY